ncbi:hypothetical protein D3C80_1567460 [compost metagenome]
MQLMYQRRLPHTGFPGDQHQLRLPADALAEGRRQPGQLNITAVYFLRNPEHVMPVIRSNGKAGLAGQHFF